MKLSLVQMLEELKTVGFGFCFAFGFFGRKQIICSWGKKNVGKQFSNQTKRGLVCLTCSPHSVQLDV